MNPSRSSAQAIGELLGLFFLLIAALELRADDWVDVNGLIPAREPQRWEDVMEQVDLPNGYNLPVIIDGRTGTIESLQGVVSPSLGYNPKERLELYQYTNSLTEAARKFSQKSEPTLKEILENFDRIMWEDEMERRRRQNEKRLIFVGGGFEVCHRCLCTDSVWGRSGARARLLYPLLALLTLWVSARVASAGLNRCITIHR